MNNFIKILLFSLLIITHALYGFKPGSTLSSNSIESSVLNLSSLKRETLIDGYCKLYNIPKHTNLLIRYFVYDDPSKYSSQSLPTDLSGQDLRYFDFTGCHFTYTNLTDTNLQNVILTNTTCDYQNTFRSNFKKNMVNGGYWYQVNIPKDLASITQVYPKLRNNRHKAQLLHIACGLSRLPFYKGAAFYIKVQYWSLVLLRLKQELGNPYGQQLICSLGNDLKNDAAVYCWTTNYPQNTVMTAIVPPHDNFGTYLENFRQGLIKWKNKSKHKDGFNYYKDQIEKDIKNLQAIYPKIKLAAYQTKVNYMLRALSNSYQYQGLSFLFHYLFWKNRIIRLKELVHINLKNDVQYGCEILDYFANYCCWSNESTAYTQYGRSYLT